MQVAVIEFARNVLGITGADSTEFNPGTPNPVVVFMPEISTQHMGGTMRLGGRRTVLQSVNCLTAKLYQKERFIDERHRHRCAREGSAMVLARLPAGWLRAARRHGCARGLQASGARAVPHARRRALRRRCKRRLPRPS